MRTATETVTVRAGDVVAYRGSLVQRRGAAVYVGVCTDLRCMDALARADEAGKACEPRFELIDRARTAALARREDPRGTEEDPVHVPGHLDRRVGHDRDRPYALTATRPGRASGRAAARQRPFEGRAIYVEDLAAPTS
jgi:hypothetical protein